MTPELIKLAASVLEDKRRRNQTYTDKVNAGALHKPIKKVSSRVLSYTEKHRGTWFKPEYNLEEIQIAQDTDSYLFRAISKKTNKFLAAGWDFVGSNPDTVAYIKKRLLEIELASEKPFFLTMSETVHDLLRFSNCKWAKVRDKRASSGKIRIDIQGRELEPVAGYFILPFETLRFKTKQNGEIKKVMQVTPSGKREEHKPENLIHFYTNRKPGFAIGTPELIPALDDIALLRRIEENVEDLIECNLFPLFHYSIGTDAMPERYGPDGMKESDIVRRTIEYMPAGGIFISDHRHKIEAIGSEGRALRINDYLEYFKKRVFTSLGVSPIDMGEGDSSNRSTASTLSKSMLQDVEALQQVIGAFLEFYVINELLLEGPFADPLSEDNRVHIKFGVVDREEQTKVENQANLLFQGKLLTQTEARKRLGYRAMRPQDFEDTVFELYEKPLAEIKLPAPGDSPGVNRAVATASRPENQHGTRSAPKMSGDRLIEFTSEHFDQAQALFYHSLESGIADSGCTQNVDAQIEFDGLLDLYTADLAKWKSYVKSRITECDNLCNTDIIISNLKYRLDIIDKYYLSKSHNCGLVIGARALNISEVFLLPEDNCCDTCNEPYNKSINITDVDVISIPPYTHKCNHRDDNCDR